MGEIARESQDDLPIFRREGKRKKTAQRPENEKTCPWWLQIGCKFLGASGVVRAWEKIMSKKKERGIVRGRQAVCPWYLVYGLYTKKVPTDNPSVPRVGTRFYAKSLNLGGPGYISRKVEQGQKRNKTSLAGAKMAPPLVTF
jgi:hypothetical protein